MPYPIIQTKLTIPSHPAFAVARPHLVEQLNQGLARGHRLLLVTAPPGYGKTTLLSAWARQSVARLNSMKRLTLSIFLILLLATACTARSFGVKDAWARLGNIGGNSAIYFIVENPTNQADKLLSASSDAADTVEVHLSTMVEEGMMMMEPQESVEIPAGKNVSFEPGGLHVMLVGLKNDLKVGDRLEVTLKFEFAGELTVEAQVRER